MKKLSKCSLLHEVETTLSMLPNNKYQLQTTKEDHPYFKYATKYDVELKKKNTKIIVGNSD